MLSCVSPYLLCPSQNTNISVQIDIAQSENAKTDYISISYHINCWLFWADCVVRRQSLRENHVSNRIAMVSVASMCDNQQRLWHFTKSARCDIDNTFWSEQFGHFTKSAWCDIDNTFWSEQFDIKSICSSLRQLWVGGRITNNHCHCSIDLLDC